MQDTSPRPLETLELTRDAERAAQTFATPDLFLQISTCSRPAHILQKLHAGLAIRMRVSLRRRFFRCQTGLHFASKCYGTS
jgi:hypothetical protein